MQSELNPPRLLSAVAICMLCFASARGQMLATPATRCSGLLFCAYYQGSRLLLALRCSCCPLACTSPPPTVHFPVVPDPLNWYAPSRGSDLRSQVKAGLLAAQLLMHLFAFACTALHSRQLEAGSLLLFQFEASLASYCTGGERAELSLPVRIKIERTGTEALR